MRERDPATFRSRDGRNFATLASLRVDWQIPRFSAVSSQGHSPVTLANGFSRSDNQVFSLGIIRYPAGYRDKLGLDCGRFDPKRRRGKDQEVMDPAPTRPARSISRFSRSTTVSCCGYAHYYVTQDSQAPHSCKAMGFKSAQLTSLNVFQNSGVQCLRFRSAESGPLENG